MMEIEIGDVFKHGMLLFKVIEEINISTSRCSILFDNRIVATTYEHKTTLLKMEKLSSLEKELT